MCPETVAGGISPVILCRGASRLIGFSKSFFVSFLVDDFTLRTLSVEP